MDSSTTLKVRKKGWIIILLLCIAGYYTFYYNFVFARTAAIVTVVKKEKHTMSIRYADHTEQTVNVPQIILPLIKEGNTYFVSIYRNNYRKPFVKSIKPSPLNFAYRREYIEGSEKDPSRRILFFMSGMMEKSKRYQHLGLVRCYNPVKYKFRWCGVGYER
ncbi:hypothetical protein ACFPYJ_24990 [Paenibacillus solisilvae]|uniref:Uncharacterized protein n=1 Tax=Paenibacillus solisilvae TaxID=2486751 RepID=A0ABW0W4C4_9BACL